MFFGEDRISVMREMILAGGVGEREKALAKLLPIQRQDFVEIFRAMHGLPVTIRLLDPPLHEFLPSRQELITEINELKFNSLRLDYVSCSPFRVPIARLASAQARIGEK